MERVAKVTDRPSGRRWARLVAYVLNESRVCWLCGHGGADTADHVLPVATHPHLAWDVRNLKPAHGRGRTVAADGFTCRGNYSRGDEAAPTNASRSRQWR